MNDDFNKIAKILELDQEEADNFKITFVALYITNILEVDNSDELKKAADVSSDYFFSYLNELLDKNKINADLIAEAYTKTINEFASELKKVLNFDQIEKFRKLTQLP